MLGAIIGDFVGSRFERQNFKSKDFHLFAKESRFTDDTILTLATAYAIQNDVPYDVAYHKFYHLYPDGRYGKSFVKWANSPILAPYNSYGNGSAMRISPVTHYFNNLSEIRFNAQRSAEATHNHEEGIRGAQAIAESIFLAGNGSSKEELKTHIQNSYGYDLEFSIEGIRSSYAFDCTCQKTVPQAIVAFLDSNDFVDAIRIAVSLGGDSDTLASMAGAIAEVFYGLEPVIAQVVIGKLKEHKELFDVYAQFKLDQKNG